MNIYKYAMQLEKDSENYYNKLMNETDDVGLQAILKMLAGEEAKHFSIVEQMMKNNTHPELIETDILKNARNIFEKIKGKKLEFNFDLTQADFYRKA
ncbi:MAG TPA: rubrerythrin, partial [Atribacterota bacterium]|nr:rubrerythrin [Atribacterota bacterium]